MPGLDKEKQVVTIMMKAPQGMKRKPILLLSIKIEEINSPSKARTAITKNIVGPFVKSNKNTVNAATITKKMGKRIKKTICRFFFKGFVLFSSIWKPPIATK